MKWVKHDTDANQDAKLQNVLLDYGLDGYGLYWYCIELIAGKVDNDNITFELEHDARIIARNTGSSVQKVQEMMTYFVNEGLFENNDGVVTCLKLAKRLDKSMTSNAQMREIIGNLKSHDSVMIKSAKPMQDKIRLDKNRLDKNREDINPIVKPEAKPSKYKFDAYHMEISDWMLSRLLVLYPNLKRPNLDSWANTLRLMIEVDKRDPAMISKVFEWANQDTFWSSNILSADSLRKQFDKLAVKVNQPANNQSTLNRISSDFSKKPEGWS